MTGPRLRSHRAALPFIFVTLVLDVAALGLVAPVLPQLVQHIGRIDAAQTARLFGLFATTFAAAQFLASPMHGALSDRFGRRPVILAANFGLGADYVILALAPTIPWLFLGRLIAGVCAGGMSAASAYVVDVSAPAKRAAAFGLVSAVVGVGGGVAPLLGGYLGSVDLRAPFWAAAALSLANGVYGALVLPESLPTERRSALKWSMINPIGAVQAVLAANPRMTTVIVAIMLFALGNQAVGSVGVIYTAQRFHWTPADRGLLLAAFGLGAVAVQGGLTPIAVRALGEWRTMVLGIAGQIAGVFVLGLAPSGAGYWAGSLAMIVGYVAIPAWQALLSQMVAPSEQGRLAGANMSIRALSLMAGPIVFTQMLAIGLATTRPLLMGLPFLLAGALWIVGLPLAAFGLRPAPAASPEAPPGQVSTPVGAD
jgi:MFS transporter, DHA1 family, tetracycline resistance protein